jgi:hypothetical protein
MGTQASGTIDDKALCHKLHGFWLEATTAQGLLTAAGVSASQGAGAAVHAALSVADAELTGIEIGAANDELYWEIDKAQLWDCDWDFPVHAQVVFESAGGAGDLPVFTLDLKGLAKDQVYSDAGATPDGTITFAAYSVVLTSGRAVTPKQSFGIVDLSADEAYLVKLTCTDLGSASADEIQVRGVRLWYVPKMMTDNYTKELT